MFLLVLPVIILISIIILITCRWPIFYIQKRVGQHNKTFNLIKFRTMVNGAHNLQGKYKSKNEAKGPVFKIRDDPRFTKIGKFLSHTGLDEMPQLYNILKDEMSLIGPRPLPETEANKLSSAQKKRHKLKPGIISPWIVNGYHSNSFNSWMQSDLMYVKNKNLFYDLNLFVKAASLCTKLLFIEIKETLFVAKVDPG